MTKKSNIKTRYEQRIGKLEQALDKACELLSSYDKRYREEMNQWSKKEWKEYLTKEVGNG